MELVLLRTIAAVVLGELPHESPRVNRQKESSHSVVASVLEIVADRAAAGYL